MRLTIHIPNLRTLNEKNQRGHWSRKAKRTKTQRLAARAHMRCCFVNMNSFAQVVTLTRIAPRALDEGDNLAMALSAVRDGVADALGINDRDPRVTWRYAQRRGGAKEYGVVIEIEPRVEDPT